MMPDGGGALESEVYNTVNVVGWCVGERGEDTDHISLRSPRRMGEDVRARFTVGGRVPCP
jgi:hypothetical protein